MRATAAIRAAVVTCGVWACGADSQSADQPEGRDLGQLIVAVADLQIEQAVGFGCADPPEDIDIIEVLGVQKPGGLAGVLFTNTAVPIGRETRDAVMAGLAPRTVRFVAPPAGGLSTREDATVLLALADPVMEGDNAWMTGEIASGSVCVASRERFERGADGGWEYSPPPSESD